MVCLRVSLQRWSAWVITYGCAVSRARRTPSGLIHAAVSGRVPPIHVTPTLEPPVSKLHAQYLRGCALANAPISCLAEESEIRADDLSNLSGISNRGSRGSTLSRARSRARVDVSLATVKASGPADVPHRPRCVLARSAASAG